MTIMLRLSLWSLLGVGWFSLVAVGAPPIDPVLEWNLIALNALKADFSDPNNGPEHSGPTKSSRALAIVHAAMYDAANSIDGTHDPYRISVPLAKGASLDAAVARAAHDTLIALYTRQTDELDQRLEETLKRIPAGIAKIQGQLVGALVAKVILNLRADDGSDDNTPYTPSDQPGFHRPDPLHPDQGFHGPNWSKVKPFAIANPANFVIPPPPALDSPEYAEAFNEVKELGSVDSATRTDDQTIIGTFWGYDGTPGLGTPPRLYNQVARTISQQMKSTPVENARLFALLNLAQGDAGIVCWQDKYGYEFWRPILAVREADAGTGPSGLGDNNPDTTGDVNWEPLGAPASNASGTNFTPPFPAYASGHATFGSTTFQILRQFYGTDRIAFSFVSDEYNGITTDQNGVVRPRIERKYRTLTEADEENGISRIYLGIHWRFDKESGMACGKDIANAIYNTKLRPRR